MKTQKAKPKPKPTKNAVVIPWPSEALRHARQLNARQLMYSLRSLAAKARQ